MSDIQPQGPEAATSGAAAPTSAPTASSSGGRTRAAASMASGFDAQTTLLAPVQKTGGARAVQRRGGEAVQARASREGSGGGGDSAASSSGTTSAAGTAPPAASGGPGSDAVHRRHPNGVPVAIYLMPSQEDKSRWTREMTGLSIADAARRAGPAGSSGRARRVFNAMREAGRTETTAEDAAGLAEAKYGNDLEFSRQAPRHAAARGSVAAVGGGLQMGQAMPYTRQEPNRWKENIKAVSDAVGPLRGGGASSPGPGTAGAASTEPATSTSTAPEPARGGRRAPEIRANHRNINEVAIFTHGGSNSLDLGSWIGPGAVAGFLGTAVTSSVNVQLYACNAGAEGGMAQHLAEELSRATGGSANVFGHEVAGHTTRNSLGHSFRAENGRITLNASNFDAVFSPDYLGTERTRLAGELGVGADEIDRVLRDTARRWMARAGNGTGIDIRGARAAAPGTSAAPARGTPSQVTAAQAFGVDLEGTVRLVREHWQREGTERVRQALSGGDRRRRTSRA